MTTVDTPTSVGCPVLGCDWQSDGPPALLDAIRRTHLRFRHRLDDLVQTVAELESRPPTAVSTRAVDLARWLVSLDEVDGPGVEERRAVTLPQIIDRARRALDGDRADG